MDLEQLAFMESPMTLAITVATPAILAAALTIGCGKKREPIKVQEKSGKNVGKAGSAVKSKKTSSKSRRSASKKSGKEKDSKSAKKRSSKVKDEKKSKSDKFKSASGKKKSSSKSSKSNSLKPKAMKSKLETLIKEASTQRASTKDVQAPDSGADKNASTRQYLEADKRAARQAHAAALAATQDDGSQKSAPTQRNVSQKQPGSQGGQGSQEPVHAADHNNNVVNGRKQQKIEPLIPIELQLLSQFYASECLVLKAGQESGAYKFQPPRSLLDSSHEIKMEPAELRWSTAGGLQKISIVNQTGDRQAIKVKCSDNNVYRVNPVFAFIEPGQTLNVDVMRQNGSNKVDKLVFITSKAAPEDNNPKQLFKPGTTNNSMMVLPLLATQPPPTIAAVN